MYSMERCSQSVDGADLIHLLASNLGCWTRYLLPSDSGRPHTFVQLIGRWHGKERSPPTRRLPTLNPEPSPLAPGWTGSWLFKRQISGIGGVSDALSEK